MKKTVDQSRSVWMDTSKLPLESILTEAISTDVCIVGAGIAGMSTAYLLAREGKAVVLAGAVGSAEEIRPGSGAVVARGLHKVAVYRDPEGEISEHSAVCPHLGGIVSWNTLENTWDCPCHGSRFDAAGEAIQGPANSDLVKIGAE